MIIILTTIVIMIQKGIVLIMIIVMIIIIIVQDGFVKFGVKFPGQRMLSDMDHCRVVLR